MTLPGNNSVSGGGMFLARYGMPSCADSLVFSTVEFSHEAFNLTLFPNPAKSIINLILEKDLSYAKASLYTMKGQLMQSASFSGSTGSIEVSSLSSGFYMLILQDVDGEVISRKKVVVER